MPMTPEEQRAKAQKLTRMLDWAEEGRDDDDRGRRQPARRKLVRRVGGGGPRRPSSGVSGPGFG